VQLADLETFVARFEQQLQSFDQLHSGELQTLKQQLDAIQKIQQDELQLLREQLSQLKERLAAYLADTTSAATPIEMTVTRRESRV
jgi:cell shape-determining protein MreC